MPSSPLGARQGSPPAWVDRDKACEANRLGWMVKRSSVHGQSCEFVKETGRSRRLLPSARRE